MNIINEEKQYICQTYKRFNVVFTKGSGKYIWDNKGKKYLDFFAGISVCNLGHCNKAVTKAICKQAATLVHASNHYHTLPQVALAKSLIKKSIKGKVFFSNSGAEANECAIKLARKRGKSVDLSGAKYEIVTFSNSFHGRTMATLSATAQEKFHKGFEPMLPGFKYAQFNDISSLQNAVSPKTCAVLLEPVQGEGGINICTKEFLEALKKLSIKYNFLVIFDEVQSGLGRTGKFMAYEHFGVMPDIITLGKSLGGGLPIGATIAGANASDIFTYGDHGSTFGGNLLSCAAADAVVKELKPAMLSAINKNGRYFLYKLKALESKYSGIVKEARGLGLMLALELKEEGRDIVEYCLQKGLLINCTQNTILRFLPPFIINKKDIDTAVKILEDALSCKISKK